MAKKTTTYYAGIINAKILDAHSTAKAFYTEYDRGNWASGHNSMVWIPKSICQFGEPNEFGNLVVRVPAWFFNRNSLEYRRCIDIQWCR